MRISVWFRQKGPMSKSLHKVIDLAAVPFPGCWFEYEPGWGLARIASAGEPGLKVTICASAIEIDGYGPQFQADEVERLVELGWELK